MHAAVAVPAGDLRKHDWLKPDLDYRRPDKLANRGDHPRRASVARRAGVETEHYVCTLRPSAESPVDADV